MQLPQIPPSPANISVSFSLVLEKEVSLGPVRAYKNSVCAPVSIFSHLLNPFPSVTPAITYIFFLSPLFFPPLILLYMLTFLPLKKKKFVLLLHSSVDRSLILKILEVVICDHNLFFLCHSLYIALKLVL